MPHTHKLPDGRETGRDQVDPDNPRKHRHMLDGDRTSAENFDAEHIHIINGVLTGPPIEPKGIAMPQEVKYLGGKVTSFKQIDRTEGQFGIVEGYIATWDIDRGDYFGVRDQFVKGAFQASIADHLNRKRHVRFKDHHGRTIGVFPIDTVREDERGLFGVAEINLEVQQGREVYSLVKQGALTDFSVGFIVEEFTEEIDLRTITKATLLEGSIVDEPMNPHANVTGFKAVVPFQDLPLAERDKPWDASAVVGRVRAFTESEDEPSAKYRQAFVWYDRENSNTFGAYKLPVADVIDGRLTVIPRAVFAAAAVLQGARGGVDIPESDRPGTIRHIERYYAKMDLESPFSDDSKQYFTESDVKSLTTRDLEKALRRGGTFSKAGAKLLVSKIVLDDSKLTNDNGNLEDVEKLRKLVSDLKSISIK